MKRKFLTTLVYMIAISGSLLFVYVLFASTLSSIISIIITLMYFSMSYFSLMYVNKKNITLVNKFIYMSQYNIMFISSLILITSFYGLISLSGCIVLFLLESSNKKAVKENDQINKENLFVGLSSLICVTMIVIIFYMAVI